MEGDRTAHYSKSRKTIKTDSMGRNQKKCHSINKYVITTKGSHPNSSPHTNMNSILLPNQHDVLCVKDKTYAKHVGNIMFHDLITQYALQYDIGSKLKKMQLTSYIVNYMKQQYQSRFLRLVQNNRISKEGEDDSMETNQDKTKHSVRSAATITRIPIDTDECTTTTESNSLQQASRSFYWEVITDKQARDKTSHALRFASKQIRRKQEAKSISDGTEGSVRSTMMTPTLKESTPCTVKKASEIVKIPKQEKRKSKMDHGRTQNIIPCHESVCEKRDDNDNDSLATTDSFMELYDRQQDILIDIKVKQDKFQKQQFQRHGKGGIIVDDEDATASQLPNTIEIPTNTLNRTKKQRPYGTRPQSKWSDQTKSTQWNKKVNEMYHNRDNNSSRGNTIPISSSILSSHNYVSPSSTKELSRGLSVGDDLFQLLDMSIMTLESL